MEESQPVTRRQFLKEASLVVGGAAIASIALTSACGSPENTTTSSATTTTNTTTSINTTTNTITSTGTWSGVYVPPQEKPERLPILGCENETKVATDRKYSVEHMWVKSITDDIVVIGISEKFLALLEDIYYVTLLDEGTVVNRDLYLGSIDSSKMNVELMAPISGTVLQNNDEVRTDPGTIFNDKPYDIVYASGWMQVIKLSKPEELNDLLTPDEYKSLNEKLIVQ
jgi:glycine cleavage system H protein